MKFGIKILDQINITHFAHIISSITKLCAKSANEKSCILKLTIDSMYFILTEFASNNAASSGLGRTSFWMNIDPKSIFDYYIVEGKSMEENFILLELQPDVLNQTLKSNPNVKMVRIKLTKRKSTCLTVELDLHSISSKISSRTITHDIPIKIVSTSKQSEDFEEPSIDKTTLSIEMPPLKLIKHMIERMKCLSDFIYLDATNKGTLTLKTEADSVSVCSYFRNLINLPIKTCSSSNNRILNEINGTDSSVRLSLKKLNEFINALQFQPNKIICNFIDQKYAHFFVVHDDDLVLQYLISSVMN